MPSCKVCGNISTIIEQSRSFFGTEYKCPQCGKYIVENSAASDFEDKKFRNCLYYYFKHLKKNNKKVFLISNSINDPDEFNMITSSEILTLYPNCITDRVNKILINLVDFQPNIGKIIEINTNYTLLSAMFFAEKEDDTCLNEIKQVILMLNDLNLLKIIDNSYGQFTITYKGWERLDELNSINKKHKKAFIAMWFDSQMYPFRDAIKRAMESKNYLPMIIDEKEHNNQIVPEILYEIRTSDFLVVDITGDRSGVYYEAGYALGLGKEVIFAFKEDTAIKPHFDVGQINQIRYKTAEELEEKLIRRIEATVGDANS